MHRAEHGLEVAVFWCSENFVLFFTCSRKVYLTFALVCISLSEASRVSHVQQQKKKKGGKLRCKGILCTLRGNMKAVGRRRWHQNGAAYNAYPSYL